MRTIPILFLLFIHILFADHVTNYENFRKVPKMIENQEQLEININLAKSVKPIIENLNYNEEYDLSIKTISLADTTKEGFLAGYRIQIFKTDNFQKAKIREQYYVEKFGEDEVSLIFEKPFYKIRAGNFLTKDDAEDFQRKLFLEGLKNTLIIPDLIDPELLIDKKEENTPDSLNNNSKPNINEIKDIENE